MQNEGQTPYRFVGSQGSCGSVGFVGYKLQATGYQLVRLYIGGIDLDAHSLPNQIDSQDETCVRALADKTPDDAFQRAVLHFDHHPLTNERARIELQIAFEETANAIDFVLGDWRRLSFKRDDIDDAGALQNRERLFFLEAREAVAGKERPVDSFLPIFPAAPACDGGEKRVEMPALDLLAHDLLVTRPRPDGEPAWGHLEIY
jgi:hypothetical protein